MTIALDASGDLFIADLGNNRVQEVTCGFADKTTYAYDAYGNLTSETDPLGRTTTATYDPLGDLLTETSPMGNVTANTYDADQELTSSTAGYESAAAATTTYTYDGSGNVLTTVTPRGNVAGGTPSDFTTTNAYDALGDLVSVTDPYGHSTTYAYDAAGNKLSIWPGEPQRTRPRSVASSRSGWRAGRAVLPCGRSAPVSSSCRGDRTDPTRRASRRRSRRRVRRTRACGGHSRQ